MLGISSCSASPFFVVFGAFVTAMTLAALSVALGTGGLRRWFCTPRVTSVLRPAVTASPSDPDEQLERR